MKKKLSSFTPAEQSQILRQKKIYDYLITSRKSFYGGGYMQIYMQKYRYRKMGLPAPIISMIGKPGQDPDTWFDYKCGIGDSVGAMVDRMIIW